MTVTASPEALTRWLPALDPTCLRLLLLFVTSGDRANDAANDPGDRPGGGAAIRLKEIADAIGQHRRTARLHIRHLQDARLLTVRERYYQCCDCGSLGAPARAANAYIVNKDVLERGPP